ncbi:Protein of unknown function [Cribrihabitans marinus]|uniref:DUF3306 domain-containing protein n=1 Tax=Cribrihabitans marinus TaxID=1227549 RepID=A0A1H6ZCA2_9RHOB|nr:DUF3306 domain-containing protein [Cribrihabitans marinus]GGH30927.1 hypothetical protein GCM10010973_21390 [Cribrihabitans marinus]SEJ51203.1 Protein of unknown function [Cribrihabitans marinus]
MSAGSDFWSRRRASVAAEQEAEHAALAAEQAEAERAALADRSDAEILEELDLPDPDSLQPGDDVSGFMARAVPDRLRRRALRRLWRLNPVLANVDGLVDYGGDYTDAACMIENLQTAYQVGRGMLAHAETLARQEEAAEVAAAEPEDPDARKPVEAPEEPAPAYAATPMAQTGDEAPPAPRRMRFEFEG